MADTIGQPAKAPKKKKTFAFLKSAPKPKPAFDTDDDEPKDKNKDDEDNLAMFKRSKEFFPQLIKEQDEIARETTPPPAKPKHDFDDDDDDLTPSPIIHSSKRRKLSPTPEQDQSWRESTEDLYGAPTPPRRASKSPSSDLESNTHETARSTKSKSRDSIGLVKSDLLPTPRRSSSSKHVVAHNVISLDDDDDPFAGPSPNKRTSSPSPRKARSTSSGKESTPAAIVLDSDEEDESAEADPYAYLIEETRAKEAAAKAAAAGLEEPIISVKIFIHSRLKEAPNLAPFGVKRGITQDLGYVRKHYVRWAINNGAAISEELADKIFLTWKGTRLYSSSTGLSLNWPTGEINKAPRTPGYTSKGILLEAWTEESFAQYTAEQERQQRRDRGEEVEEEEEDEAEEEKEQEKPRFKIILKEKDAEPFKTTVFAELQVKILISAYRRQRNVPTDREIRLRYEGEWMDPESSLEHWDVDDMCTIEVYLK